MTKEAEAAKAQEEPKPLTEKQKAELRVQRNNYKKQLKEDVEILELEIKWLQYTLAKPELEMKLFKLQEQQQKAMEEHMKEQVKEVKHPSKEEKPKEETKVIKMKPNK